MLEKFCIAFVVVVLIEGLGLTATTATAPHFAFFYAQNKKKT